MACRRPTGWRTASRAVFFSDFLGDIEALKPALAHAADQGVRGCFVQVLDETEETFPFDGRMIFESMGRTDRVRDPAGAGAARAPTTSGWRSGGRRSSSYARHLGWRWYFHDTTAPPRKALLWLYMALGRAGVTR